MKSLLNIGYLLIFISSILLLTSNAQQISLLPKTSDNNLNAEFDNLEADAGNSSPETLVQAQTINNNIRKIRTGFSEQVQDNDNDDRDDINNKYLNKRSEKNENIDEQPIKHKKVRINPFLVNHEKKLKIKSFEPSKNHEIKVKLEEPVKPKVESIVQNTADTVVVKATAGVKAVKADVEIVESKLENAKKYIISKYNSFSDFISKQFTHNSGVWNTVLFYSKIFGLLAIFILFIYLTKIMISKLKHSIYGKAEAAQELNYKNEAEHQITKPNQDQFNTKEKNSIIIKGRKKRMPDQINYNELFTTYNPIAEEQFNKNSEELTANPDLLNMTNINKCSKSVSEPNNLKESLVKTENDRDLISFSKEKEIEFNSDCSFLLHNQNPQSPKSIHNKSIISEKSEKSEKSVNESLEDSESMFDKRRKNENIYKQTVFLKCLQEQQKKK